MGTIYDQGVDYVVTNNGLTGLSAGDWRRGISLDGSAFAAYDVSVTSGSVSNPTTGGGAKFSGSGRRILNDTEDWGTWTLDLAQTIGALDVQVYNTDVSTWLNFGRIDGNDLPSTEDDGTDVTLAINATNGTFDFIRPGLADIIRDGLSGFTAYYVLLDNGTPIGGGATVNETQSGVPSWNYNTSVSPRELSAGGDVEFSNNSGGDWNVTGIEVRNGSETGPTEFRDTLSATVADGGAITFTSIVQEIQNLT